MIRDDRGLYLRVDPNGRKYWILRYWEQGKEHQISLGPYPLIGLKDARVKRDEIQIERLKGNSPQTKRQRQEQKAQRQAQSFAHIVQEWEKVRLEGRTPGYIRSIRYKLTNYILPALKDRIISDITAQDVLRLCRQIEAEGHATTAQRVKNIIGQVFKFAVASGVADVDPTAFLRGALKPMSVRHYATLTDPDEIRGLVSAIHEYPYVVMRSALMFSVLTFARPGEVRKAEWAEIKGDLWDIPAERMKMRRRHLVPLSTQAQELLSELRTYTGTGRYLFPSSRGRGCVGGSSVMLALRNLGYTKDQITLHGFRAMASTILNENGWNRDVIERQLAHVQGGVRASYNHAEYLDQRRQMMQWWGDWLYQSSSEAME